MIGTDANPGATSPGAHRFCRRRHTLPLSLSSNQPVPVDAFCGAICHLDRMCPVQRRCCLRQGRQWLWPVRAGEHPRKSSAVKATESFPHRPPVTTVPGKTTNHPPSDHHPVGTQLPLTRQFPSDRERGTRSTPLPVGESLYETPLREDGPQEVPPQLWSGGRSSFRHCISHRMRTVRPWTCGPLSVGGKGHRRCRFPTRGS